MDPGTVHIIRQVLIGVMIFSFLGLLISSIWYGSRVTALTIDTLQVSGGETISHEEIKTSVWGELQGTYLGIIPRTFALTFPEADILAKLSGIERIKNIRVARNGGKEVTVSFDEFTPESLWCSPDENPTCVFLDETGYAFSKAPQLTGGSFMRYSLVGTQPETGRAILTDDKFETLKNLVLLLADAGWYVSRADIDAADDVYLQVIGGGELKATLNQTPVETVNNLLVVLRAEEFADIAPGNFKYIDLRFGNKVFVNEVLFTEQELIEFEEQPVEVGVFSETETLVESEVASQESEVVTESDWDRQTAEAISRFSSSSVEQ